MPQEIISIMAGANCFLVKTSDGGFVLIDTGIATKRADLEKELANAGCIPGNLKLILLTHGDTDHADNCVYLRDKYAVKIAMHRDDSGMVERGDMSWNRKSKPDKISFLGSIIIRMEKLGLFGKAGRFETFKPDIYVEDGQHLSAYGFDATVLHLPGHSKGSIGILTADGALFCGDLLMNMLKPAIHFMIDDLAELNASVAKLKSLNIKTIYPGHGSPFPMEDILTTTF